MDHLSPDLNDPSASSRVTCCAQASGRIPCIVVSASRDADETVNATLIPAALEIVKVSPLDVPPLIWSANAAAISSGLILKSPLKSPAV